jgi:hypothetical protein
MNWLRKLGAPGRVIHRGLGLEKTRVKTTTLTQEVSKVTPAHIAPWIFVGVGVLWLWTQEG